MGDGQAQYFWYKKYLIPLFKKSGLSNTVLFGSKISTPTLIAEMMTNFDCSNAKSISSVHFNLDLHMKIYALLKFYGALKIKMFIKSATVRMW